MGDLWQRALDGKDVGDEPAAVVATRVGHQHIEDQQDNVIYVGSGSRSDGDWLSAPRRLSGVEPTDHYPVCMAKTQYSLSADPALKGAPKGFVVSIRDVRVSGGAEFVVAICGDVMTMPGLPRVPAANNITVDDTGRIAGLF